ncbi:MAG: hypothetical protein DYG89_04860 [Caldilinea sp. CFX5]|nr:hypothetical protein [Caldilinea sp. CFX5]
MDYSRLLNRAWTIVWTHKFLIFLGVLAALGGGEGGNNISWQMSGSNGDNQPTVDWGENVFTRIPVWLLVFGVAFLLALGLILWVVSTVARGGLIAGVDTIERGGETTFLTAWNAGWQKVWTLLGIALLPILPILLLLAAGLTSVGTLVGFTALFRGELDFPLRTSFGVTLVAMACLTVPVALGLMLLRNFAERACLLENVGVFAAYRRGWEVLTHNLGPAIILFLIQIGLSILLGISMIGPGLVMALCFLLWPLLLLIGGAVAAYFSTLWTLAWREWTVGNTTGPQDLTGFENLSGLV